MNKQQQIYEDLSRQDNAAKWFLKTPDRTSKAFVEYVEWIETSRRLDYGCVLDKYLTPPQPGDYITIIARPGHKKSTLMAALAKRYVKQIVADKKETDEVVIYATWDEAVENIEGYITSGFGEFDAGQVAWGKVSAEQAKRAAIKRVGQLSPFWIWGKSIMDRDHSKPLFTAEWLLKTVQATHQKYGVKVKALFLDYLQIIPVDNERNRTEAVTAASKAAKELAKEIGCPVIAGVQAGRGVDQYGDKMPSWSDAQHSSAIEQDSTKQLAIMNPIRTLNPDDLEIVNNGGLVGFDIGSSRYKVDDDLTIVRILKQRGARGAGTFAIGINQNTLNIYDPITADKTNLNGA